MVLAEDDDVLPEILNTGVVQYILKSLKKFNESDNLACYAFELIFLLTCNEALCPRLVELDIIKYLAVAIENFAGSEGTSVWALRTMGRLASVVDKIANKIKAVGLCEFIVQSVQRLMKSKDVCRHGCLAMGLIAKESPENSSRLTDAGACEVCTQALSRHESVVETADDICTAIHWLASSNNNNVQWFGANGACEAIISIIKRHNSNKNVFIIESSVRALGTLAQNEDGNIKKFQDAGVSEQLVISMKKFGAITYVAMQLCRAVAFLCSEPKMVSELGQKGACPLIAAMLKAHAAKPDVVVQACYAIAGLAVKMKTEKVHIANTNRLVSKDIINHVVNAMKTFENKNDVQRACAMAVASLGRQEANSLKLGELGICNLIHNSFKSFYSDITVAGKLALTVEVLCTNNEKHLGKKMSL